MATSSTISACRTATTYPWRISVEKNRVPMTATPSAPASCWAASTTPTAEPTLSPLSGDKMKSYTGPISIPNPMPVRTPGLAS